jgi:ketosteroid isomerase-like protein
MASVPTTDPFVQRFAAAWSSRDARRLGELLHPDVVLIQPMMPVLRGRGTAVRALARFIELVPDLQITIHDAMRRDDVVFIAFSFSGTIGRRRVAWGLVDRLELIDDLVRERVSYFDPRPVSRALLRQPVTWFRLARRAWRRLVRRRSPLDDRPLTS